MKKVLPILILIIAGVAAYFLFFKKEEKKPEGEKQQPLALGDRSNIFNDSYNKMLTAYTTVKEALIASDTARATAAARELAIAADSLQVQEMKADTNLRATARDFANSLSSSADKLAEAADLNGKRKEFKMIADALYTLTQTVQYDGQKLYLIYCPMAFNNTGAHWVSTDSKVRNPYFGDEMLECGTVQDSLDYSKK